MKPLTSDEIAVRLRTLESWSLTEAGRLRRTFRFPDFASALAFTNVIGAEAERRDHHPDVLVGWGRAEVTLWTHDAAGLTERDFDLARRIEDASDGLPG